MKKFQNESKPIRKRLMSWILVLALLLQTVVAAVAIIPVRVDALSAEANVVSSALDSGISYITTKNLSYYGDRTYKLSLTATSSVRDAYETGVRTATEDGYMTVAADAEGYYLLELYGGDGGSGQTTNRGGDGKGGEGGYAFGYIWLDEGDTLVWTIGTIGESTVYADEDGSGENNEDAGHGDKGSYAVGAGGGYSAIYKIPNGVDYAPGENGKVISEDERLQYYIMIAGGGGGGGAGNGALFPNTGNSDGGAGGTVSADSGVFLTAQDNWMNGGVEGWYFSGEDGETSGYKVGFINTTRYDYVGRGGTNIPGPNPDTWIGWREAGIAQYWNEGGAGGSGNYRGGGGGAGFAGGSGGIMAGALDPCNIGGGGGGSSFIAKAVTRFKLDNSYEGPEDLLQGPGGNDNESGSGGKAIITYLGIDSSTRAYTEHLEDVTINGEISKYFDVLSVSVDNGNHQNATFTTNGNKITVEHADISPDELGYPDDENSLNIDIIIKAKSDFFGGNSVPVLADNKNFTLTTAEKDYNPDGVDGSKHFDPMTFYFAGEKDGNGDAYDDSADYCNVSLNLTASGNAYSYSESNIPDPFIKLENLYNDIYQDYRNDMSLFSSSCLETITPYQVFEEGSSTALTSLARPTSAGTWNYTVGYYVTSKVKAADAAIVGPVVQDNTFISDAAIIIILKAGQIPVKDGNTDYYLEVDKLLSYDSASGLYHLQVAMNGNSKYNPNAPYAMHKYRDYDFDTSASQTETNTANVPAQNTLEVPVTGWYSIGVRGGQGGDGQGAEAQAGNYERQGGYGAFGDDVTGYVWLEKGQKLTWYLGDDNCEYNRNINVTNNGKGGVGGEASWIAVDGEFLIIAAGGAGGGGAKSRTGSRNNGSSNTTWDGGHIHGNVAGIISTYDGPITKYNGGTGQTGDDGRGAGSQPDSYRNSRVYTSLNTTNTAGKGDFNIASTPYFIDHDENPEGGIGVNGQTGEFKVAGVQVSLIYEQEANVVVGLNWSDNTGSQTGKIESSASKNGFYDHLELGVEFAKYFDLVRIEYDNSTADSSAFGANKSLGGKLNYTVSQTPEGTTKVHFDTIDYDGSTYAYVTKNQRWDYTVNFEAILDGLTFDFYLKPKDGFIGGNDVPFLVRTADKDDQGIAYSGIDVTIPYDNATRNVAEIDQVDFTNVAINYEFETDNFVTKQGIKMNCGDELDGLEALLEQSENGEYKDIVPCITDPTDPNYWKWEFVNALNARQVYERDVEADPSAKIGGALFETTPYTLTQCIEPKTDSTKAVIVGPVSPVECDNHVTVIVVRPVQEKVKNATIIYDTTVDGVDTETSGDEENPTETVKVSTEADLTGTVVADKGYELPDDITVYVCGTQMTNGYTYSSLSGDFTIPADEVRKLVADDDLHSQLDPSLANEHQHVIVIEAEATEMELDLTFVWWDENGEDHDTFDDEFITYLKKASGAENVDITLPTGGNSHKFVTSAKLTGNSWFDQFLALDRIELPGHKEFKWIWPTDDEKPLTEMPGVNTKVPGYVTDKTYYVNVHFVEEGTTGPDLTDPIQVFGAFESFTLVESPAIEGWVAKNASTIVNIVEDSDGNMIEDVYVEYIKAEGQLMVYHVKADTKEQLKVEDIRITDPGTESVSVMKVDHYTPYYNDQKVTGNTVDIEITREDITNGKTAYIYYKPDQFKLKFNSNAGDADADVVYKTNDKTERTIEYNNSFGYDAEDEKFIQFPKPERKGYRFLGWYADNAPREDESSIAEATLINDYIGSSDEITLYAQWEPMPYKVIVNYTFLDKNGNKMETSNAYYPSDAEEQTYTEWNYEQQFTSDVPNFVGFEVTNVERADGQPVENYAIRGTMPAVDLVYNVTYQQLTYTLTINFEWDGEEAEKPTLPETKTFTLVYGEDYNITRAALEDALAEALSAYNTYTLDEDLKVEFAAVSGTMGTDNLTVTVYYTNDPIVNYEIEWTDFIFTLSDVDYNIDTHEYYSHQIDPTDGAGNYVKVTNYSKDELAVEFKYNPKDEYSSLIGSFDIEGGAQGNNKATVAANGGETKADFALSLSDSETGFEVSDMLIGGEESFISGNITVVIGEEEAYSDLQDVEQNNE